MTEPKEYHRDWIDRDGYLEKKRLAIRLMCNPNSPCFDPDRAMIEEELLDEEASSSAEIDNLPKVVEVENQTCENCGWQSDYDNHCYNCKIVIIRGRGNWKPLSPEQEQIMEAIK